MEERSTIFVEAMLVVAVIGVLAFLIGLLARVPQRRKAATTGPGEPVQSPQWYEFALALLLLAAIAAFAVWLISNGNHWVWGEAIGDWRADTRNIIFAAIMVALGVIGLIVSLAYAAVQSSQRPVAARPPAGTAAEAAAPAAAATPVPGASPLRIFGILLPVVAVLLMFWIYLPLAQQHELMVQLIYPASLGLTLVLLLDRATRTWGNKSGAESLRDWLLCDLLLFLLVLGFLNVRGLAKPETYNSGFWDILNLLLFFGAFWLIDRSASRARFLAGYGYLIVLPVLLLIWQTMQGVAATASWWASIWPFLILAAAFFVLEAVTLVASSGERQTMPAIKDTVFVVLYGVLLIVAAKSF